MVVYICMTLWTAGLLLRIFLIPGSNIQHNRKINPPRTWNKPNEIHKGKTSSRIVFMVLLQIFFGLLYIFHSKPMPWCFMCRVWQNSKYARKHNHICSPWSVPGSLTSSFLWWGNTFPAFPVDAQPAVLRLWQEDHWRHEQVTEVEIIHWFTQFIVECNYWRMPWIPACDVTTLVYALQ